MQTELKRLVRQYQVSANITAGLGSVFAAIGHKYIKPGGLLALVLPRALLSGVAWKETRKLIGEYYSVKYIIVSHEQKNWNFSENTSLSECLLVAKKHANGTQTTATKTINLWNKPRSSIEALTVAELIRAASGVSLDSDNGVEELRTENQKFGEILICPPERIRAGEWGEQVAFAQTELCRAASRLTKGEVYIPGLGQMGNVSLVPLGQLGKLGPDRRDIHDGFRTTPSSTTYPAFWGHDTESVQHISQRPNQYLSPLARAQRGRHLRDPHLFGRVLENCL